MTTIATMGVRMFADTRRLSAGLLKAQTEMGFTIRNAGRLEEKMSKVGMTAGVVARGFHIASGAFRAVAIGAAVAGVAVVAFGAKASKVARDYEDQWLKVKAITQSTAAEMATMQKGTFAKSIAMGISPTKMMKGNVESARTGLSGREVSGIEESVAKLATVEMVEFANAAEKGTDVAKAFKMAMRPDRDAAGTGEAQGFVKGFEETANILATVAATSNTTLDRLHAGLTKVASTAGTATVPLEQAAAAMGMLGNVGFKGEEAGVAIRNVLTRAYADTSKVKDIIDKTGMSLAKAGKSNDFITNLKELEDINLSPQNLFEIFGLRAGPAVIAMLEEGSEKLALYQKFLEESKGLNQMFQDMQGATAIALGRVSAVLEVAGIMIGSVLNVAVKEAAERFLAWVGPIEGAMDSVRKFTTNALMFMLGGIESVLRAMPPFLSGIAHLVDAIRLLGKTTKFVFEFMVNAGSHMFKVMAKITHALVTAMASPFIAIHARIKEIISAVETMAGGGSMASKFMAIKEMFNMGDQSTFMDSFRAELDEATVLVKEAFKTWQDMMMKGLGDGGLLDEFAKSLAPAEMLKVSNIMDKVGKGFTLAADEVKDFKAAVEKALQDPDNTANSKYLEMLKKFQEEYALLEAKWDGGNHVDHAKEKKGTKEKKKQLGLINRYAIRAAQINDRQDEARLKEKARLNLEAAKLDISRKNISMADKEFLLLDAGVTHHREILKIENDIAKTVKDREADRVKEQRAIEARLKAERAASILEGVKSFQTGMGQFGGAGGADSLTAQLGEAQAKVDRMHLEGIELINNDITKQNNLIIEQIALYEQLADTVGTSFPSMIDSLSQVNKDTWDTADGTKAILGAVGNMASIGTAAFAAMGMGARQQRHAQMALNLAMAAFALGMGFVSLGMAPAQAPGYFAAAAAFGTKAALGGAAGGAGKGLRTTKHDPGASDKKDAADVVKRGVVDALKEAGIYQPWEKLTINTFGTTPADYGGSGNLPGARKVEYHNQSNSRTRG